MAYRHANESRSPHEPRSARDWSDNDHRGRHIHLRAVPGNRERSGARRQAQAANEPKLDLGDLIKQANQSVVIINIENNAGQKIGFGSGFLIDDKGLVATNFHVVARAAKAGVVFEFKDGNKAEVKSLRAFDKKRDLAIVELDKTPKLAKTLSLGPRTFPALGDR